MQRVFAVWLCLALGVACRANIITVDDDGPADYTTIQAAIDASNNGDIVVVCPGTYTGVGNYNINFGGKAITVRSTNPQDPTVVAATIIDCEHLGRGFNFDNSEGPDSIINGFTIINAEDPFPMEPGGAIRCDGSSPTVANCRILNSIGYIGGGVCNENGSCPTLVNCVFSGNVSDFYGGAISNVLSDPNVINCTFIGNSAWEGGGAIYNDASWPTLSNCVFSGNDAEWGGGIFNDYDCTSKVTNCTFSDNLATDLGGAIFNNGYSSTTLSNCILWGNGPDEVYVNAGTVTVYYSNVQGGYPGTGNINEEPLFVDADGPDEVVGTEDDDLRLSSGSPCIDAGDSTAVGPDTADIDEDGGTTEQTPWDIDGNLRFLDDPSTTDTGITEGPIPIVDMGAYESSGLAMIGDFEPDGDVDLDDLAVIVVRWLDKGCGTCGGADLSGDGSVNLADFAKFAQTGLVGGGQRHKPILAPIGNKYIFEQQNLSFLVSAIDPDGDILIYSAFNLPSGAGFDTATRIFDWTPTESQTGQYFVTFLVSDGIELDSETVAITVTPEPVGYWKMDDDADNTTVSDSSSNENHGTAQQNTSNINTTGIIDGALSFNGIDDYIQIADSEPLSPTQEVTVCGWFYFNNANENVGLIWKHGYNYLLRTGSSTIWFIVWNPSAEESQATFSTSLLSSGWNFIAGVFDGTNSMLYLNGVQVGTLGASITGGIRDRAGDLYIGQRSDGAGERHFDGKIDDVKIYGRALTPAEITSLYNLAP